MAQINHFWVNPWTNIETNKGLPEMIFPKRPGPLLEWIQYLPGSNYIPISLFRKTSLFIKKRTWVVSQIRSICDVIKQNESLLTNTVFKIQSNKADSFFCFLLFVQSFNCLYLWNQLSNLCGVFTKLKPKQYPNRKCRKTKNHIFWLQTHFAWLHHIYIWGSRCVVSTEYIELRCCFSLMTHFALDNLNTQEMTPTECIMGRPVYRLCCLPSSSANQVLEEIITNNVATFFTACIFHV